MRAQPSLDTALVFGPFRLVPSRNILLRGNRPIKLGGRALDILHLLLMRAGEEVSKGALLEFAWPNVFVDEHNLKVHVSSLRRALGDKLQQPTYIATVVGRGYQFVGRVETACIEVANLPTTHGAAGEPPTLIGRARDIESIKRALDTSTLVTLVGPGGVGKTSLAGAVVQAVQGEFSDGVRFVDLSTTSDSTLIPHLIAVALGISSGPADLTSAIVSHLRHRRTLLVLDNCEHVLSGAADVAVRLLDANIAGRLLATSREPLGLPAEAVQTVEILGYPEKAQVRSASDALDYPSIELFALRASETGYELVDCDAVAVAGLCEALGGLPLAIEITAAKVGEFPPTELLKSLNLGLTSVLEGVRIHGRSGTMWATLDWSYRMLSDEEATVFRLLSVFAGSFDWTDVAGVARLVQFDPCQITVALGGLVAKSLVSADIQEGLLRYQLLDSARQYAAEALRKDPLAFQAHRHHAELVLSVFERSETEWAFIDHCSWRARYEPRIGDLRKALDWCFGDQGNRALGVDLTIAAIRLWNEQSSIFEQLSQVGRALRHCGSDAEAVSKRAVLATSLAWSMTLARQSLAKTDEAWKASLSLAEESGNVCRQLCVMSGHAVFLIYTGRHEQAVQHLDVFTRIATQSGDHASLVDGERLRALAGLHLGRLTDVRDKLEQLAGELANGMPPSKIARYHEQRYVSIHTTLAFTNWLTGRTERALAMTEDMVMKTGQIGQLMGQSNVLALVAMPLALWSGRIRALHRYTTMLRDNLDRENIAIWEPAHRFYASFGRHADGDPLAVNDMRAVVDELVRERFLARTPMYLGVVAEALLERHRSAEASEAVNEALSLQRVSKEVWCLPELLRVKAWVTAFRGRRDNARTILAGARESALKIGAKTMEMRIAHDVAKLEAGGVHHRRERSGVIA